jgi:hypothetical protein
LQFEGSKKSLSQKAPFQKGSKKSLQKVLQKVLRADDISKFQATKLIVRSKVPTRGHEPVLEERLPISNATANLNS